MRRLFLHSPKAYAAALVLGAALTVLNIWSRGGGLLFRWADALSTAGAFLILLGLLGLVARLGAFDTMAYGFSRMWKPRYKDLVEYTQAKAEKRSRAPLGFMPFVAVGVLFLAAGLILRAMV
ncbi:MAG: DUF3899 domain-containing protein [Oscillospiraceae bacterium]|nr:DUF3899 domain-containing protein [Oscillospiraceae bacterium]